MQRRISTLIILSLVLMAFFAMTATAAKAPIVKKADKKLFDNTRILSFPDEYDYQVNSSNLSPLRNSSVGRSASAFAGATIGDTWYDYQHNGTMGRMIAWGPFTTGTPGSAGIAADASATNETRVFFTWMGLPGPVMDSRKYYYNFYDATNGAFNGSGQVGLQTSDEYAGYVGAEATSAGHAIVGGHNNPAQATTGIYQAEIKRCFNNSTSTLFPYSNRVPDTTAAYAGDAGQSVIWPKFVYQEGTANVLHVIAQVSAPNAADPQANYYFRGVTTTDLVSVTWDYPPYVIDTSYDLSHDVAAEYFGDKVALIWTGNLPAAGDCDTCSGESEIHVQWDNDIYYQISDDQGVTWNPRVNVTLNVNGEAGFRPYTDLSSLIDSDGDLHILWSAVYWPENPLSEGWSEACKLFHWSESQPYIRTVADANYTSEICIPGAWNINISKMQISECEGKIYAMWVQFNGDANHDDCASRANGGNGDVSGSANGELMLAVSDDDGLTWDASRNLTNTYTPLCEATDSITSDCESENWPSMAKFGRQDLAGEDWSSAVIVDPSGGSYAGDNYLDVQYIADIDPGGIVQDEGIWTLNDLRWFRIPCVDPVPNPVLSLSWREFDVPDYTKLGVQRDEVLSIENIGNSDLHYTTSIVEDNGPPGWLAISGFSGTTPSGLSNVETGTVNLNNGGVQTTEAYLNGRIVFTSDAPSSPDTVTINLVVADTIVGSTWDTLFSGCLALSISNSGNYGQAGAGGVNLDWTYSDSDCDTTAEVYLYDGSPLLLWDTTGGYVYQNDMFGQTYIDEDGFRAIESGNCVKTSADVNQSITDVFVTYDSSIAMQQSFWASPNTDSCDFVIQGIAMWSNDGSAHNDLRVGAGYDWDIPSDSGSDNTSDFDFSRNLIYQVGAEFHQDDDPDSCGGVDQPDCPCQDSDVRFGGVSYIGSYLQGGTSVSAFPTGGYTGENDTLVYPTGNFVPAKLWANMGTAGFTASDSTEDLHMVMVFDTAYDLTSTDTVYYYAIMATVENGTAADLQATVDKAKAWADNHVPYGDAFVCSCCSGVTGDMNGDGGYTADISDLLYLVDYMFVPGSPAPPCLAEGDVNGDLGPVPDISDLLYLVDYMFTPGSPAPAACP